MDALQQEHFYPVLGVGQDRIQFLNIQILIKTRRNLISLFEDPRPNDVLSKGHEFMGQAGSFYFIICMPISNDVHFSGQIQAPSIVACDGRNATCPRPLR